MASILDILRNIGRTPIPEKYRKPISNVADKLGIAAGSLLKGASFGAVDPFKGKNTQPFFGQSGQIFQAPDTTGEKIGAEIIESIPGTIVGGQLFKGLSGVQKLQKPLVSKGSQILAGDVFKNKIAQNLIGKGLLNVAEGIPYSFGSYASRAIKDREVPTGEDLAFDVGIDLATGALPIIGLGASALSKSGADEVIEKGLKEGFEKSARGQIDEEAVRVYKSMAKDNANRAVVSKQIRQIDDQINQINSEIRSMYENADDALKKDKKFKRSVSELLSRRTDLNTKQKDLINSKNSINTVQIDSGSTPKQVDLQTPSTPDIKVPEVEVKMPKQKDKTVKGMIKDRVLLPIYDARDRAVNAIGNKDTRAVLQDYELGKIKDKGIKKNLDDLFVKLKNYAEEVTGEPIKDTKDYVSRIILGGSDDVESVVGSSSLSGSWSPFEQRTGSVAAGDRELFINDVGEIVDRYINAVNRKANATVEEAARRNIPVESVVKQKEAVDNVKKAIESGNAKKLREANALSELKEAANIAGKEVDTIKMPKTFTIADNLRTDSNVLEKMGIYHVFELLVTWQDRVANFLVETKDMGWRQQIDAFVQRYPFAEDIYDQLTYIDRVARRMEAKGNDPKKYVERIFYAKSKQNAYESFADEIVKYDFKGRDEDYIEGLVNQVLGWDIVSTKLTDRIQAQLRKTIYSGALGLNIRSMLLNPFEIKRAWGTTDTKNVAKALQQASVDKGEIFERFPSFSNIYITREQILEKGGVKGAAKKLGKSYNKLLDATLKPFQMTENFKNKVFLYAYLNEAEKMGLQGDQVVNYVTKKFNKYALSGGKWNTPQIYKKEIVKTAAQLGQYTLKEADILIDAMRGASKGEKEAIKYLVKWGASSAVIAGTMSSLIGANPLDFIAQVPGLNIKKDEGDYGDDNFLGTNYEVNVQVAPIIQMLMAAGTATTDYLNDANNKEGQGKVSQWNESKLMQAGSLLVPAGSQLLGKTGVQTLVPDQIAGLAPDAIENAPPSGFLGDMERGYRPTLRGNVKYPVADDPVNIAKGLMFGGWATDQHRENKDVLNVAGSRGVLDKNESEIYINLNDTEGFESAEQYYKNTVLNRKVGDNTVAGILAEKDDKYAKSQDITISGNDKMPSDIFLQDIEEKARWSDINSHMNDDGLTAEQKYKLLDQKLQSYGLTRRDWEEKKIKSSTVKTRAKWIIENEETDFVSLYDKDILSLEVLKELQREGYINDAKSLWDKVKLSDPYYRKQEEEKIRKEYLKGAAKYYKGIADILGKSAKKPSYKKPKANLPSIKKPSNSRISYIKADTKSIKSMIKGFDRIAEEAEGRL